MVFPKVSLVVLLIAAPLAVSAQSQNWWLIGDAGTEAGKLQELKEKRRVFLSVAFNTNELDVNAQQEATVIRRLVTQAVSSYSGLQLVSTPEQAEIAINIVASSGPAETPAAGIADSGPQTPLDVTITVRGRMQRDGNYRPRVVWSMSSQNVHGQPGPAAAFAIDGFIEQLRKVRGEKK